MATKEKTVIFGRKKSTLPTLETALEGRTDVVDVPDRHFVNGNRIRPPYPDGLATATFGMGCFWGAERLFWQLPGVYSTAVGYAGGFTENATYREVCSGTTGHAEVVQVVYDPAITSYEMLLKTFWEEHDPTQGMRQGNDAGTQYRSAIYFETDDERAVAERTRDDVQGGLTSMGYDQITTEIAPLTKFYFAEAYHQQYLAKNPNGYCGIAGTGVSCPVGVGAERESSPEG